MMYSRDNGLTSIYIRVELNEMKSAILSGLLQGKRRLDDAEKIHK